MKEFRWQKGRKSQFKFVKMLRTRNYCVKWTIVVAVAIEAAKANIKDDIDILFVRCVIWLDLHRSDADRLDLSVYWWVWPKKAKAIQTHTRILAPPATVLVWFGLVCVVCANRTTTIEWTNSNEKRPKRWQRRHRRWWLLWWKRRWKMKQEKNTVNSLKQKWN